MAIKKQKRVMKIRVGGGKRNNNRGTLIVYLDDKPSVLLVGTLASSDSLAKPWLCEYNVISQIKYCRAKLGQCMDHSGLHIW